MNEFDELKQKLKEIARLLWKIVTAGMTEISQRITDLYRQATNASKGTGKTEQTSSSPSGKGLTPQARLLILFLGVLVIGIWIGSIFSHGGKSEAAVNSSNPPGFNLFQFFFGRTIPVPGKQTDGTFVFGDFENDQGLKAWKLIDAKIELTSAHVSQGTHAAKIILYGGQVISGLQLDDYFETRKAMKNWSAYESIRFHVYNPRSETERLILQIKDRRENRYKQDIHIPAASGRDFSVPIERISASINVREIDQISLFRWEPRGDRDFFVDNIRLVPKGYVDPAAAAKPKVEMEIKDRPVNLMDYGFRLRRPAWQVTDPIEKIQYVRIPFVLKNESAGECTPCQAQGGIPLPMGELKSVENLRLRDSERQDVPFQAKVLATWPDKTIKWISVSLQPVLKPGEGKGFFLEYGAGIKPAEPVEQIVPAGERAGSAKLTLTESPDEFVINTGPLEVALSKKEFYVFKSVSVDQNLNGSVEPAEIVAANAAAVLQFNDDEYRANYDNQTYRISIEEQGPEKIVFRSEGWFQSSKGGRFCQLILRHYFYRGQTSVSLAHTLIYTGYPENRFYEKYKGVSLPANETIQSFGIKLPYRLPPGEEWTATFGIDNADDRTYTADTHTVHAIQMDYDAARIDTKTEKVPITHGLSGWMDLSGKTAGLSIAIRNLRENFPKSITLLSDLQEIQIGLWPKELGSLDLSTTSNSVGPEDASRGSAFGFGKTHEMQFHFHAGDLQVSNAKSKAQSFQKPVIIRTNPFWIDAAGVFGRFMPVDPRPYASDEKAISDLFDWAERHPRNFKWYGMVNFGDTLTWWRNEDDSQWYGDWGWHPTGRWGWYSCEGLGLHTGSLINFARTGLWKYFEFGRNIAKHIMDVDTVHYNTVAKDPRLKKLNDEVSKVGSMHRHSGDHWSGRNEESSHTSVVGILMYYYLTGDERAEEVAKEIGEFFLLEPYAYTGHPDVVPHRAMANALWGDVLLYQLTWNSDYKKAADKVIEIYLRGQQPDGSFLENYNPLDEKWSGDKHQLYMEGYALGAIMAYHELTQDSEVKEMLIKLVRYLGQAGSGASSLHGYSYAYFLTGEPYFAQLITNGLNEIRQNQKPSTDPLLNGLVFHKPIYHRPNTYLYSMAYAFAAIDADRLRR